MKPRVYVESSVISYLTARPSRDLVKAARQAITDQWWRQARADFDLFISQLVTMEISQGNAEAAARRLQAVEMLESLSVGDEAKRVARQLLASGAVPANSEDDALHIGLAAANGMNYLLTWNFKHINNVATEKAIRDVIESLGHAAPELCSPEELRTPR